MVDYLIVGGGLAGIAFAEQARLNNKSFVVIDSGSGGSSVVAAGLYNPVVLKRLKAVSGAAEHLDKMEVFYLNLKAAIDATVKHPLPILRRFMSVEEQNDWFASPEPTNMFLSSKLHKLDIPGLSSPYGFGEVLRTGYVDTAKLITHYHSYLFTNELLKIESFEHANLCVDTQTVTYNDIRCRHIIFAEGFGMCQNPYFRYLPLNGTKGELMVIKAPELKLDVIINGNIFILPLGDHYYKIGATYNWKDKSTIPTDEGKAELIARLSEILTCDFEIVSHVAGIRPTVKDRKPLVGSHHFYKNLHILNGLGTRGVMLAPAMAEVLFNAIEHNADIPREINIERFNALLQP